MTTSRDETDGTFVGVDTHADVVVAVVTYNSAADIGFLVSDLRTAARDRRIRLIVVDNQSSDGTQEIVRAHPDVQLLDSGGNLGYAGGINVALPSVGSCNALLILNPDLRVTPDCVNRLLGVLAEDDRIGAVVPRILDMEGQAYPSLRYEPSITRVFGDSICGSKLWLGRPGFLSEFDYRSGSYGVAHAVDWATGAALLVRAEVVRELGPWNEEFFLYSEETEYFRRIREIGRLVWFEPSAVVRHRLGGSGTSQGLAALMAVNRVRYAEMFHGRTYTAFIRAAVLLAEVLRSYDPDHRRTLAVLACRRRWDDLPRATKPPVLEQLSGQRRRGAVIVPAYNEAAVIERTLTPLSRAATDGYIELIVVCNGCTDDTADRARRVPGAQVVELSVGSKPLALNAGDELATLWPRLYLDADIEITAGAVLSVLDRLARGDTLAARPAFQYGLNGASAIVRSYYRARTRSTLNREALWWAGVYGLNERGHERFGRFPEVIADDMFVDTQFSEHEKAVVDTEPSIWRTPSDLDGLVTVLARHYRGSAEVAREQGTAQTGKATARAILGTIRGARSAVDAAVYLCIALMARRRAARSAVAWERDDTSRSRT